MLALLQRIEPGLKELKVTRKEAPASYPELMKVIKNHTRSSDYMVQFMKKPIAIDSSNMCDCKACELGLFMPQRMPIEAYEKLQKNLFPLPIPQSSQGVPASELRYMSFEDSIALPFTDAHQPSKKTLAVVDIPSTSQGIGRGRGRGRRGRGGGRGNAPTPIIRFQSQASSIRKIPLRKQFTLGHKMRLRGIVQCVECQKPRCVYSHQSISHMVPPGESTIEEQTECR